MAAPQQPGGVHDLDLFTQQLYDAVEAKVAFLQERFRGPTPVGTRKLSSREWARRLYQMRPDQMAQLMARTSEDSPIFANALDRLGAHGLALLPYLQPAGLFGEQEAPPVNLFEEM